MNQTETLQPMGKLDGHINTFSGRKVNLLDPRPEQINIRDIARGLAFNSHFGGHTPKFFSIAQHCILVCDILMQNFKDNPELLMYGLLHDASEAYLGDMVKPLKVMLPEFQKIENRMMDVILEKYQLNRDSHAIIKEADIMAQEQEFNAFYKGGDISYLSPWEARSTFMRYFYIFLNQREWKNEV